MRSVCRKVCWAKLHLLNYPEALLTLSFGLIKSPAIGQRILQSLSPPRKLKDTTENPALVFPVTGPHHEATVEKSAINQLPNIQKETIISEIALSFQGFRSCKPRNRVTISPLKKLALVVIL